MKENQGWVERFDEKFKGELWLEKIEDDPENEYGDRGDLLNFVQQEINKAVLEEREKTEYIIKLMSDVLTLEQRNKVLGELYTQGITRVLSTLTK